MKKGELEVNDDFNIWGWVHSAGAILLVATFIGFLGDFYWVFDLFSQFRIQYFFISLLLLLVVSVMRRRDQKLIMKYLFVFVVNLVFLWPLFEGKPSSEISGKGPYRALLINLNSGNIRKDLVRKYVLNESADFVTLLEVTESWQSYLRGVNDVYPYMKFLAREDNFGLAVLSKFPIVNEEIRYLGEASKPTLRLGLDVDGKTLQLVVAHAFPPFGGKSTEFRDTQLRLLSDVGKNNDPTLLMADLNIVPWSSKFKKLLANSEMTDSSAGYGLQTTWPSFTSVMGVPIDHVLLSREIRLLDRKIGKYVGSDHLPVIVEFMIDSSLKNKVKNTSQ